MATEGGNREEKKSDFYWEPTKYLLLVTALGLFLLNVKQPFRKFIIIFYLTDEYIASLSFIEQLYHCSLFLCKVLCLNLVSNVNIITKYIIWRVFLICTLWSALASRVAQWWRIHLPMHESQEMQVQSLGWEDALEEVAASFSILAWKTLWTEQPGGLQSMGSQRCGHDWATNTFTFFARDEENTEIGNWL